MKKTFLSLACAALAVCGLSACGGSAPTLDKSELSIVEGDSVTIEASYEGKEELVWSAEDTSIVTVEGEGTKAVVTAVAEGETVVYVTAGETRAECKITVTAPPLSIFLPEGKIVLKKNVTATVKAHTTLQGEAVWTVSDPTVASLDAEGLTVRVTALKVGECTLSVKVGESTATVTVIVGTL